MSERTIHSDLNTIETWLRDKHLPLMFERKRYRYLVEWSASRKEQLKRALNEETQTEMDKTASSVIDFPSASSKRRI